MSVARKWTILGIVAANVAALGYFVPKWIAGRYLDLEVYRFGAKTWLGGGDLYGRLPPTSVGLSLPFTYPPVSAVLFVPLTLMTLAAGGLLLTGIGLAGVILMPHGVSRRWAAVAVLPLAAVLEPVRATLYYGQINLLLMALVMVDCLTPRPRWPRGMLVGLAAAIKLTPAGFVLFFLLRRDFRAVVAAAVGFGVTTAIGFLFAGADSVRYWSGELFATGRIGTPHYAGNQSLLGALARFGIGPPIRTIVWLIGVAVIMWLAVRAMRKAAGNPRLALVFNALAVLVVSPVSWSHHWVWILPILAVLPWRPVVAAVFVAAPQWWWPGTENTEYTWNLAQQVLGNSYLWFAILMLAVGSRLAAVIAPCAAPSVIRTA